MNQTRAMTPAETRKLCSLAEIHKKLRTLTEVLSEEEYRNQFNPLISPIGWHIYHTLFVENFFLHETANGDAGFSEPMKSVGLPENMEKSERGKALPAKQSLSRMLAKQHRINAALLSNPSAPLRSHPLMKNNYLPLFLIQHHAMHIETICTAFTERRLNRFRSKFNPRTRLMPSTPKLKPVAFRAGNRILGNNTAAGFDNEKPTHTKRVRQFSINRTEVSNAEFLAFMYDNGYENPALWSDSGWKWLQSNRVQAPHHWRLSPRGHWFGINCHGPYTLQAEMPVHGISCYEAEAFAKWAHARLPLEHELEIAFKTRRLKPAAVWEWCGNTFHPYPEFQPFPYQRYSKTWFDQRHITLKGGSPYTAPVLRRASFRNFHLPETRHIFAGIRLAFDRLA